MKEKVKKVMRYSGPRMLLPHPTLALHHALDCTAKAPEIEQENKLANNYGNLFLASGLFHLMFHCPTKS